MCIPCKENERKLLMDRLTDRQQQSNMPSGFFEGGYKNMVQVYTLWIDAQINRKLIFNSYYNEFHDIACQHKECDKI
jgi:hypothetical protein